MTGLSKSLSILAYGPSKAGKSTFAASAPYPRLMLDVESGARFLPITAVVWDPIREAPPVADGTWDTCVVAVRDYEAVLKVYSWLQSGKHPFKSLIIDSISELQVKCIDNLVGQEQMKMQDWGQLLRHMAGLLRDLRDLTMHPTNALEAVVLTAMAKQGQDGLYHPYLQGQVATIAPYLFDVIGYIRVEEFPHADPTQGMYKVRRMYVETTNFAEAGERVQGRLGSIVEQGDMTVPRMLEMIYGADDPQNAVVAAAETEAIGAA